LDKIICLVGESGSGKSTLAELLEKQGYNNIQSYTTREPRYQGEKGHIFVDKIVLNKHVVLETEQKEFFRIAQTEFDGNYYWAVNTQYQNKGLSVYAIDPFGVKELKNYVKDAEIVVIYLKTDREERYTRMWERACALNTYEERHVARREVHKRIYHDRDVFRIVTCDYVVDANNCIGQVLEDITKIIEK